MEEVIVTVEKNGNARIKTKGFKGPACKLATKDLESALGAKTSDTNTPEFYEKQPNLTVANRG
jgi:uncharacterized ferredoxin-like protein